MTETVPDAAQDRASVLVRLSARLQEASTLDELTEAFQAGVSQLTRYQTAWIAWFHEDLELIDLVTIRGQGAERVWERLDNIPVAGDPMIAEILAANGPVVVEDARTDPRTNKDIVQALGNRTIINVPFGFLDRPAILTAAGTFAPEPPLPPTDDELQSLTALGAIVAVSAARIRYQQEQEAAAAERRRLEAQVLRAQKLESLGLLAGGVAHDFNNLLTAILGGITGARHASDPEDALESLELAELGALRARDLTARMLAFAGEGPVLLRALDVHAACEELVSLVRLSHPRTVRWQVSGDRVGVRGDDGQLRQVLLNLLTNAADALERADGRITVHTSALDALPELAWVVAPQGSGPWVRIDVQDDGRGMSEQTLARIFDPFFSTKGAGRGLGMAAVLGIVSRHDGGLAVRSVPGEGTTFSLLLPQADLSGSEAPERVQHGTILLADDDPQVRTWLEAELRRAGHTVTAVDDGPAALHALLDQDHDLAILDVLMPSLSGPMVLERLRERGRDLPTLFVSGFTDGTDLPRGPTVRSRAKPLGREDLLAAVQELLALDEAPEGAT